MQKYPESAKKKNIADSDSPAQAAPLGISLVLSLGFRGSSSHVLLTQKMPLLNSKVPGL